MKRDTQMSRQGTKYVESHNEQTVHYMGVETGILHFMERSIEEAGVISDLTCIHTNGSLTA